MTDGWKTRLHVLSRQEPDEGKLRSLVEGGHHPLRDVPETTGAGGRLVAGIVAFAVFAGAFSLILNSESDVPAPTEQVIGFHGLLLTVPASWAINDQTCGTPKHDTVLRDLGGVLLCLIDRPRGISSVELMDDPAYWLPKIQQLDTLTNPNGVRLERGKVPDRPDIAIYAPAVDVLMFINTVSGGQSKAIVDSIELADIDPNGCAMREMQLDPPASYEPPAAMRDVLIPGSPSGIAICHYVDNWLLSSATLTGEGMSNFVGVVNGLQDGSVRAPTDTYDHSMCDEPSTAGGERGSGYILWISGLDPAPVPLWAHVGICGDLGIANGAREGQLTPEFAKLLNEPLHHGYVMPGRLVPDPSNG
jgi:hypothetical protein